MSLAVNTTPLLGSIIIVAAFGVMWWALSGTRDQQPVTLHDTDSVTDQRRLLLRQSASERAVRPFTTRLGAWLKSITPAQKVRALDAKVQQMGADESWTVERVLAAKLLLALFFFILFAIRVADDPSLGNVMLMLFATAFGFFMPNGLIDRRREARKLVIRNQVSDTIDQLNVMVRAGLGVDAALGRLSQHNQGPLADEFARVMQDMRFGLSRNVALSKMAERVDVPELRGFVSALSHADRLGVPVSQTLKVQSDELRDRRRQLAEEQAMKLPVKILFPMVFCILPVLMIVLLGPAAMRIFDQF